MSVGEEMKFLKWSVPLCVSVWFIAFCISTFGVTWWTIPMGITTLCIATGIGYKWAFGDQKLIGEKMLEQQVKTCTFSTNIADELTCSEDGNFDDYGFPVNICPFFPCERYQRLLSK